MFAQVLGDLVGEQFLDGLGVVDAQTMSNGANCLRKPMRLRICSPGECANHCIPGKLHPDVREDPMKSRPPDGDPKCP